MAELAIEEPFIDWEEPRGSNGIAIAPQNTVNGNALLLINPHTSFFHQMCSLNRHRGLTGEHRRELFILFIKLPCMRIQNFKHANKLLIRTNQRYRQKTSCCVAGLLVDV